MSTKVTTPDGRTLMSPSLSAAAPSGKTINTKPLKWVRTGTAEYRARRTNPRGTTTFNHYIVERIVAGEWETLVNGRVIATSVTKAEAQAAAKDHADEQAHFTRRV